MLFYLREHDQPLAILLALARIQAFALDRHESWVYNKRYGANRLAVVGDLVRHCVYYGGGSTILKEKERTYVDIASICGSKEKYFAKA